MADREMHIRYGMERWLSFAADTHNDYSIVDLKAKLDSNGMRAEIVTEPSKLKRAWSNQYERQAQIFARMLGKKCGLMAEIGCGSGQLTIPLAKHAPNFRIVLVDRFVGMVYSQNYKALLSNLKKAKLMKRTRIVISDYLKWLTAQNGEAFDALVSSEFLPEVNLAETSQFIQECYRLLKPRGVTVHSFLSPVPRNSRQKLVILADSDSIWTHTRPKEWFSPRPQLIIKELGRSGFQRIRKTSIRSHLVIKADAAKSLMERWEVEASFYARHKKQLNRSGLEIPDWGILSGTKS
jgi:cyclopropane fatty-acyl-phospholipid synthase-like methyltransferase